MAQHDYSIANQAGSSFRVDLNNALSAIVSQNSGSLAPSTTYAYQTWADTTAGVMKMRNGANSAWITLYDLDGSSSVQTENVITVASLNIDCAAGNYFIKTINANSTFTVSNVPPGVSYSFTLELTHTSGTVTWFSGVEWPSALVPSLTTGKTHLFMFVTDDGGTRWRGAALINYNN
jgi:hypothetical protein